MHVPYTCIITITYLYHLPPNITAHFSYKIFYGVSSVYFKHEHVCNILELLSYIICFRNYSQIIQH